MAETIYNVIDKKEKRIKWDHYNNLNAFVASLSKNPENIGEFNQFYAEITGESFYQEGPSTIDDLKDYAIVEDGSKERPEGELVSVVEAKDEKTWEIYKKQGCSPPNIPPINIELIRELSGMKSVSNEEVIKGFEKCINDYRSVSPDEKVSEDIPEITSEIIKKWKNSVHKNEYPTVKDYRRIPWIDGHPVDGIVVADLRKKELRYLTNPQCFDIQRERPSERDQRDNRHPRYKYSLPLEWKLIQE